MSALTHPLRVATVQRVITGDFSDPVKAWHTFLTVINKIPDVTIMAMARHEFPGGGLSGVVIIAESHVAIHTWPEESRAWVELATCGDPQALRDFLWELSYAGWKPDQDPTT
jgi:S-adenosylmethionine/arginine decarboxylase-like enzyme